MVMLLVEKYHPILSLPANASSCLASHACPHLCSSIRVQTPSIYIGRRKYSLQTKMSSLPVCCNINQCIGPNDFYHWNLDDLSHFNRAAPARPLRVLPRVAWPLLSRQGGGSFHSRRPPLRALAGGVRKALSRRCKCCPPPPQGQGEGRCLCGSSAARGKDCCVQPTQECQEVLLGDD
ncbi:uncharacterized protein LOC119291596 isoform X1 [Triticum dicoccoides]|uniref:uncharacterized protein LOC119291596 isoform X1 n=1 Tax=Triticum dicoccoides TaxID=85692 RepID=UPI001890A4D7|nr:uncharacterized protein LOC119291596 isoform X1 [Triticum dicoccoides]XP_037426276.1 uncharacterized protein LOC119291596 isoform X1 [Triticum dicoccoides]